MIANKCLVSVTLPLNNIWCECVSRVAVGAGAGRHSKYSELLEVDCFSVVGKCFIILLVLPPWFTITLLHILHLTLVSLSLVIWTHTFEHFTLATTDCTQIHTHTHTPHMRMNNHTHVAQTSATSLSEEKCPAAASNSSLTLKYMEIKQSKYR